MATGVVRWGLLGTGGITAKLLAGARLADRTSVVAVGSRTDERARAFAREIGVERAHGSYEALLADPDVDAVYISLPNSLHHTWTMESLAAGKHVLCEKPYTRHASEVELAWDAAEAAGLVLQEAFMWRHTPQAAKLVELLPRIGDVRTVHASFAHRLRSQENIRASVPLEGGSLMDVGCYCVSGARLILGEPEVVHGEQVLGPTGVDVRFSGLLRYPGDVTATFTSGFDHHHEGLEVVGRDGSIVVPDPWHSRAGLLLLDGEEIRVEARNPYQCELEDMARAILDGEPPRLGRQDARGQARTLEALYRAAETGTAVRL